MYPRYVAAAAEPRGACTATMRQRSESPSCHSRIASRGVEGALPEDVRHGGASPHHD